MRVEPGDGAPDAVAPMVGVDEHVAFVFVDDELGIDAERSQGVPEFVGLRRGSVSTQVIFFPSGEIEVCSKVWAEKSASMTASSGEEDFVWGASCE